MDLDSSGTVTRWRAIPFIYLYPPDVFLTYHFAESPCRLPVYREMAQDQISNEFRVIGRKVPGPLA